MTTLVDNVRAILHTQTRPLMAALGLRTNTLTIRTRAWASETTLADNVRAPWP